MLEEAKERTGRKYYLSIKDGKIVHTEAGHTKYYSSVEGTLDRLYKLERTFGNQKSLYWYIDLKGETGDRYSISLSYNSGVFKSIALSLASDIGLCSSSVVKIETYSQNNYTKVKVYSNGRKLDWAIKQLPEVKVVEVAGRTIKDDTERMQVIEGLAASIAERLEKW